MAVQLGPVEIPIVERETERLDEVQVGARGQGGAANVARVPVDLGLDQDDVQGRHDLAQGRP
jgi:hypothetical protein